MLSNARAVHICIEPLLYSPVVHRSSADCVVWPVQLYPKYFYLQEFRARPLLLLLRLCKPISGPERQIRAVMFAPLSQCATVCATSYELGKSD